MIGNGPAPTRADERIDTLDVLRGVAICGILIMNITGMGAIGETEGVFYPARWNADWIGWVVRLVAFEGTMRGLFTLLFGAGMLLMLRRAEGAAPEVAPFDVWARRCLALMALGVVQFALFFWPGEILWTYGLAGFALLAFRTARPRTLLIAAALILAAIGAQRAYQTTSRSLILLPAVSAEAAKAAGRPLTPEQKKALELVEKFRASFVPTPAELKAEQVERTHLPSLWLWSAGKWAEDHLDRMSWVSVAEQIAFMLVGMALYRTGILTGRAPAATYRRLAVLGIACGLGWRAFEAWMESRAGFALDVRQIDVPLGILRTVMLEPARLALTLGYAGLVVGLFRAGVLGRAWPLRALGRTALTVYSLQSILTSLFFYGLGYVGAFGFAGLMLVVTGVWVATMLFSLAWLRRFEMGPAEQLLRAVAYLRLPGHRRPALDAATAAVPAI